jgi:nucleoside-diphosphate-sugar epimerase
MRSFVTGGTGFIGGRLIEHLRGSGHEVVALVRDPSRARHLADLGATLAQGDITDRRSLVEPMRGVDGVFHVAAWYEVGTGGRLADSIVAGECRSWREGFETAARVSGTRLRAVWVPPIVLRASAAAMGVIERVVRVPSEYTSEALRVGAGTTFYGDSSRAREELGLETRSLERGLRETFAHP